MHEMLLIAANWKVLQHQQSRFVCSVEAEKTNQRMFWLERWDSNENWEDKMEMNHMLIVICTEDQFMSPCSLVGISSTYTCNYILINQEIKQRWSKVFTICQFWIKTCVKRSSSRFLYVSIFIFHLPSWPAALLGPGEAGGVDLGRIILSTFLFYSHINHVLINM